jgi:hypothetical protein
MLERLFVNAQDATNLITAVKRCADQVGKQLTTKSVAGFV